MKKVLPIAMAVLLLAGWGCAKKETTTTAGANSNTAVGGSTGPNANAGGSAGGGAAANTNGSASGAGSMTVRLRGVSGTREYGSVTITAVDANSSRVTITLAGADVPMNVVGEASIRAGVCGDQSATIQYPLNPLVEGRSVTELNVNYSSFVGGTKQSVWVKPDPVDTDEPQGSCGNIN